MNSQIRLVLHPADEARLVDEMLRDPAVVFINGPRWVAVTPVTTRDISTIGSYCMIWSPDDLADLAADYIPTCNDWYCRSEFATIQFRRCSIVGHVITDGRLAVSTTQAPPETADGVDRRFKMLRRRIKKTFANASVRWRNVNAPNAPATKDRSASPGDPDASLWVEPGAIEWLRADPSRRIKQLLKAPVEGTLID